MVGRDFSQFNNTSPKGKIAILNKTLRNFQLARKHKLAKEKNAFKLWMLKEIILRPNNEIRQKFITTCQQYRGNIIFSPHRRIISSPVTKRNKIFSIEDIMFYVLALVIVMTIFFALRNLRAGHSYVNPQTETSVNQYSPGNDLIKDLLSIIARAESSAGKFLRGDRGRSLGKYHICEGVVRDYNRAHGTNYKHSDLLDSVIDEKIANWHLNDIIRTLECRGNISRAKIIQFWNEGPSAVKKSIPKTHKNLIYRDIYRQHHEKSDQSDLKA